MKSTLAQFLIVLLLVVVAGSNTGCVEKNVGPMPTEEGIAQDPPEISPPDAIGVPDEEEPSGDPAVLDEDGDPLPEESVEPPAEVADPVDNGGPLDDGVDPPDEIVFDTICTPSPLSADAKSSSCTRVATLEFEAEDGASAKTDITCLFQQNPLAQKCTFRSASESVATTIDNGVAYLRTGDQWTVGPAEDPEPWLTGYTQPLFPDEAFPTLDILSNYTLVGEEDADGTTTLHFRGSDTSPFEYLVQNPNDEVEVSEGEINLWVTNQDNHPTYVRRLDIAMTGTVNGTGADFRIGQQTTYTTTFERLEAPSISLMSGLPDDIPLYPNLSGGSIITQQVYLTTADPIITVLEFHEDALAGSGYQETNRLGSEVQLPIYTYWDKGDTSIVVIVDQGEQETGSQVWIQPTEE